MATVVLTDKMKRLVILCLLQMLSQIVGNKLEKCSKLSITDALNTGISDKFNNSNYVNDCACVTKPCIRKCCPENYVLYIGKKQTICTQSNISASFDIYDKFEKQNMSKRDFHFTYGHECPGGTSKIKEQTFYLQKNGSILIPEMGQYPEEIHPPEHYCVDIINNNYEVIICVGKQSKALHWQTILGMIISMPFLLATFLVYAILPEPNLHRKALMNYVLTLLLAYITLLTVQLYPGQIGDFACALLGYMIIFFFLVSFFWMNVMCVDMWFTFSGIRGFNGRRIAERKRFLMYFAYAFGIPALHILVVYLINKYGDKRSFYYPGVGDGRCFLGEDWSYLFYFYGPMALLIVVNIILFALIAVKIQRVKKETSMLKHSESKRHSYEDDKQKFKLYVKLLFAMGINWTMEVVSWAVNWKLGRHPSVWYLTDFCNAMYGVFIFFMFVFKKKIWISLKKRYYIFRRKPYLVHSMSVTQSTRGSTTERGTTDHRLSELKNGRGGEERMSAQN